MSSRLLSTLFSLMLLTLLSGGLYAQGVTTAAFSGTVIDNEGTPMVGATVIAVHEPSGTRYGALTREGGRFNLINVRVGGPYSLTATYVGFEAVKQEGIYLQLGQNRRVKMTLAPKNVTLGEVEITASSGIMGSERTGAETVVGEAQINALPTVSRAIGDFARLTPQATVREGSDGFAISLNGMNNRYNAIYIDGAVNNDVFGLAGSGTNGGQTGVSPVSLDAIEQFQIALAPFDVRVGGFAGGAINAVTRSGTNEIEASVYGFYRNEALAGKTPADDEDIERTQLADFTALTSGFRVGGPIVKDKVFFFINAELQREETPQPFQFSTYQGDATSADMTALTTKLNGYGYEPGTYTDNLSFLNSNKILVKLDFNLNARNTLSIRHSYTGAENLEGTRSSTRNINFLGASEYFVSNTNSTALELNSMIGDLYANNLKINFTSVRDDRDPYSVANPGSDDGNFPFAIIQDGSGQIRFGSEQFSTANQLDQDIFTITDNFSIYAGNHTITLGTHNEFFSVYNLFVRQNFGVYEYSSLDQFLTDQPADEFYRSYSLVDNVTGDGSAAASEFSGAQFGVYIQDEWQVSDRLSLTGGLRFDIPVYFTDIPVNQSFNSEVIPVIESFGYDLQGAQTGDFISPQVLISPRVGFNYDVKGDRTTVIRGGVGIFTSRIPLVWPGGSFNNNGIIVGGDFATGATTGWANDWDGVFNPDWQNQPQRVTPEQGEPSGQIDLFASDFKVPQVLKVNLAIDQQLPWGVIGTLDFIYNKTLNNVAYQNVNLKPSTQNLEGVDNRPYFDRRDEIDDTYSRIMLGYNTNEGYTYNLSASLTKPFANGISGTVAYSYGDAFTVFDGTSSQNSSQWRNFANVQGRNFDQTLGRSEFSQGHRVIAGINYKFDWNAGKNFTTTFGLFYEGASGLPYSYVYNDGGAIQNEDSREYSLIYIPATQSDINLIDDGTRTAAAQWAELDAFIESDPYLSANRGGYAERFSNRAPMAHVIDFKVIQDFSFVAGGKKQTFQLTADIFNFSNFVNSGWGRRYNGGSFGAFQLIDFEGFEDNTLKPQFTFGGVEENNISKDNIDDSGVQSSRWQMQLGVRYIFN
ncbi:MAG: TonB-dependent receptor [Bacteroidia bacterium]